eukprot:Unigene3568_Nuclearia_a/m.10897 Unigene3568_Nuclearia_a/g.10897  ORF Unigene3568_Nuclearia_a/g.10897 Unigene3568_Nuclearia_a/m.10897 type:complete len:576 (-) Unigene3568_Nuclearia_a:274-2001(-)
MGRLRRTRAAWCSPRNKTSALHIAGDHDMATLLPDGTVDSSGGAGDAARKKKKRAGGGNRVHDAAGVDLAGDTTTLGVPLGSGGVRINSSDNAASTSMLLVHQPSQGDSTIGLVPLSNGSAAAASTGNVYIVPTPAAAAPGAHHDALPPHLELSHQPPCSDIVPDVWISRMPWLDTIKNLTWIDVLKFAIFLAAGPTIALVALAMEEMIILSHTATMDLVAAQPYVMFVVLPVALPIIVFISDKFFVGIQGSGIPKVLLAYRLSGTKPKRVPESIWDDLWNGGLYEGHISLRLAVAKFFMSVLTILSGASVGPEGPIVQIGASIGSAFQKVADLPFFYQKGAIMAGAATALGCIFSAPLTGLVFAIEEISGEFEHFGQRITVVTMLAIGGLVSSSIVGYEPYFGERDQPYVAAEWGAVPIVGILMGLLGGAFCRLVVESNKFRKAHPQLVAKWNLPFAALMGFIVVVLGAFTQGSVYGPGTEFSYEILDAASRGDFGTDVDFILYGPLKALASLCCAFTGVTGGLFVPAITIGVGYGRILAYLCSFAPSETVVIFAMVGHFAGVTQGPFTALMVA